MESKNSTSGSIDKLEEPLIGKEENLEPSQASMGPSTRWLLPVQSSFSSFSISASHSMDFQMEKNKSKSIDSVEKPAELIIDVHENLEPDPELCCIYRVPRPLRKMKEEAYTPRVISIGPLHRGKKELADMEKQKTRYKKEFRKRIGSEKWQELKKFIEDNEQRIRSSYEENFKLKKRDQFITMILHDAVFIIEFFLRCVSTEDDFLKDRTCLANTIWLDLQLLENQLPFFVLDGLFKLASTSLGHENGDASFISLSYAIFGHPKPGKKIPVKPEDISHFTDLSRYFMTRRTIKEYQKHRDKQGEYVLKDLPCAAKLQASGVQFEGVEQECSVDIGFQISCLKAELQIPHIDVVDHTESLIRNMMALEQCHCPDETVVCNYIFLMDKLIDTDEDVNLLAEARIISNCLGESRRVAEMFNSLCLEITVSESNYDGIIEALRDHYGNLFNKSKATLKRVYFSNLWKGSGTVAAFLLLVFNLIQAMRTIISAFE